MSETWLSYALSTSLAVSGLIGLVLLTRRAVAQRFGARVAYALWALPVLRLFVPTITIPQSWIPNLNGWGQNTQVQTDATPTYSAVFVPEATTTTVSPVSSGVNMDIIVNLTLTLWGVGIVAGLACVIFRQVRFSRHVRHTTLKPDASLRPELNHAARQVGLKSVPKIGVSLENEGPMVSGLLRPIIILPSHFIDHFDASQRRFVLLHEMSHIRRGDLWTATGMMLFRLMNWPNPLVHLAWSRFRADQEAACDASVLRLTGEIARADYAETLLTAARTAGCAYPATGTGLTLSLHHPLKERLMTLGSTQTDYRKAGRLALAALLLNGAALSAPLSLADGPKPETTTTTATTQKTIVRVMSGKEALETASGVEMREENGVKSYFRINPDGSQEVINEDEFNASYDVELEEIVVKATPHWTSNTLQGEPGLTALKSADGQTEKRIRTMIIDHQDTHANGSYEVKIDNGDKRIFRVEPDGTRTEIDESDVDMVIDLDMDDMNEEMLFPHKDGRKTIRVITTNDETNVWSSNDGDQKFYGYVNGADGSGLAMADVRLRAAQSMLESTDDMISDLREHAGGAAQKDLRDAERQLEKAQKALEKAQDAVRKSSER